ncbi:MAG: SPOR domain-containing protein [Betaproteobacteria bacterium]|jgi:DedD protein|nr:MAG: SPOR domain-containing protein [Betaproteobacteria bacterium]
MAKAISKEELQLRKRARRRLVGAIVLVLIVVVFVPMILDDEPEPVSQDISIHFPVPTIEADDTSALSTDSGPLRFRPIEPPSADLATVESRPLAQTPAVGEAAQPTASAPPVSDEPTSSPSTAALGFVVQLGAFSNAQNATRLAAKVRENRFEAYTELVITSDGKRTRVRVGPYPTRAAALQARDRLMARKLTYGEPDIVRLTD